MFLSACGISLCFYRLIQITIGANKTTQYLMLAGINSLIFSPIQLDVTGNWLMGIQMTLFISIFCFALAVIVCYSRLSLKYKFVACIILSLINSFSFANGLLSWILILPLLIILSISQWQSILKLKRYILTWLVCFLLTLYIYFDNFQRTHVASGSIDIITAPWQGFLFFLSLLGAPLGVKNLLASQIVGFILLSLFVGVCFYLIKYGKDIKLIQKVIGWLTFSFYALISNFAVTLGRAGYGIEVALWAKYTTVSLYLAVSLIGLLAIIISHARWQKSSTSRPLILKQILIFLLVLGLVWQVNSFSQGIVAMKAEKVRRLMSKTCLLLNNVIDNSDCIVKYVYIYIEVGDWNSLDFIKEHVPKVNEMKFLSPQLINSSQIKEINKDANVPMANGVFEAITIDELGKYRAKGQVTMAKNQNIGGVVLAYGNKGDETIFAIADLTLSYPVTITDMNINTTWQAEFSADQLPNPSMRITAWAIDTDTGKMLQLLNYYVGVASSHSKIEE
jgi:hypothetical protein